MNLGAGKAEAEEEEEEAIGLTLKRSPSGNAVGGASMQQVRDNLTKNPALRHA